MGRSRGSGRGLLRLAAASAASAADDAELVAKKRRGSKIIVARPARGRGGGGVSICVCCQATNDGREWHEAGGSGEAEGCKECFDLARDLGFDDFSAFCDKRLEDEDFCSEVDTARKVKAGICDRVCDDGEVSEVTRFGFTVKDDRILLTKAELKDLMPEGTDIDKLKVPTTYIPAPNGRREKYYLLKEDQTPKRVTIFMEWSGDARCVRLNSGDQLSERHIAAKLSQLVVGEGQKSEVKALFTDNMTVEDLRVKAENQVFKKSGDKPPVGGAQALRKAHSGLSLGSADIFGEQQQVPSTPTAGGMESPRALASAGAACSSDADGDLTGGLSQNNGSGRGRSRSPGAVSRKSRGGMCAASFASSTAVCTPNKAVGTEDVRSMTPHQKADYWFNQLNLMESMLDRQDRRPIRQGTELIERNKCTSDPTLKGKLEELGVRLGQVALAERLSKTGLTRASDDELDQAIDAMIGLDLALPGEVQLGLMERHLGKLADNDGLCIGFFKAAAPWRSDRSESGDCEVIFDPKRPLMHAVEMAEPAKIEYFVDWVTFNLIVPLVQKGSSYADKAVDILKAVMANCTAATEDSELSDELAAAVFDCISCCRGLVALLQRQLSADIMAVSLHKAVQQLRVSAHKTATHTICCKVATTLSKEGFFTDLLKEFAKHEVCFMECRSSVEEAFHSLEGAGAKPAGSPERHATLVHIVANIKKWEVQLRSGSLKGLSDLARKATCEHLQAHMSASANGAPGGLSTSVMVELASAASGCWPLADDFLHLKAALSKKSQDEHQSALRLDLEKACASLADAVRALSTASQVLPKDTVSSFKEAAKLAKERSLVKIPESAEILMAEVFKAMNSNGAWSGTVDVSTFVDIAMAAVPLWSTEPDKQEYYSLCLRVFDAGIKLVGNVSIISASMGAQGYDAGMFVGNVKGISDMLRATQRVKFELGRAGTLPTTAGTWQGLDGLLKSAEKTLEELKTSLVAIAAGKLETSMEALNSICYGSHENETWWDEVQGAANPEKAWDDAIQKLLAVDVKGLDSAMADTKAKRNECEEILDLFGCYDAKTTELFKTMGGLVRRAEMTKIEGTIAYIHRSAAGDEVTLRNKMAQQKNKAKALEGDGTDQQSMHPRIRKMMMDGMHFMSM